MDGNESRISPAELYESLGTGAAPVLIDVRRPENYDADDALIVGAIRRVPDRVAAWCLAIGKCRAIVVYGVSGGPTSRRVAATLAAAGLSARYVEGGMAAWRENRLPTRRRVGAVPGRWITRERPTIDRIACPWLISRFIDPEAEFVYVPAASVTAAAKETGATPYDIPNVEFGHHGEHCSFDAFIDVYRIADRALDLLASVVRGADTNRPDLTPQSPGLLAISQGLKRNFADDYAMLAQGMIVYDALYSWCRSQVRPGART